MDLSKEYDIIKIIATVYKYNMKRIYLYDKKEKEAISLGRDYSSCHNCAMYVYEGEVFRKGRIEKYADNSDWLR